jgi:hypothetical protein
MIYKSIALTRTEGIKLVDVDGEFVYGKDRHGGMRCGNCVEKVKDLSVDFQ